MIGGVARSRSVIGSGLAVGVLMVAAAAHAGELRVCADPNNLPFSNQRLEGFENKIAALVAEELNVSVRYTWRPQRRGFIRRTLKAHECDLVMGVPSDYELVLPTKPYYRSTYVFVYAKDRNFQLRSFDDPMLRRLKIGLHAIGEDGANPPPAHALARRGIIGNVVGFAMWDVDSVDSPSGKIIDAVATGEIDVAIVWGPFGGYFAKRQRAELEVVPVSPVPDPQLPSMPFVFDVSMGVRRSDAAFKHQLEQILDRRRIDIQSILKDYDIPLVDDVTPRVPSSIGGHAVIR